MEVLDKKLLLFCIILFFERFTSCLQCVGKVAEGEIRCMDWEEWSCLVGVAFLDEVVDVFHCWRCC